MDLFELGDPEKSDRNQVPKEFWLDKSPTLEDRKRDAKTMRNIGNMVVCLRFSADSPQPVRFFLRAVRVAAANRVATMTHASLVPTTRVR